MLRTEVALASGDFWGAHLCAAAQALLRGTAALLATQGISVPLQTRAFWVPLARGLSELVRHAAGGALTLQSRLQRTC